MFSDERMGAGFLPSLLRLPKGSGLVFRHHSLERSTRESLFARVQQITKARRIVLVLAETGLQLRSGGAKGVHGRGRHRTIGLKTAPAHNLRELIRAKRAGVDIVFLSPVFPTRSHIGGRTLGRRGFARLAQEAQLVGMIPIALGGMTARRMRTLTGAYGWAAIDAWVAA